MELERKIGYLRELQRLYSTLLSNSSAFTVYLQQMTDMQQKLADSYAQLSEYDAATLRVRY